MTKQPWIKPPKGITQERIVLVAAAHVGDYFIRNKLEHKNSQIARIQEQVEREIQRRVAGRLPLGEDGDYDELIASLLK